MRDKANNLRMCGFPSHETLLLSFSFGSIIHSLWREEYFIRQQIIMVLSI